MRLDFREEFHTRTQLVCTETPPELKGVEVGVGVLFLSERQPVQIIYAYLTAQQISAAGCFHRNTFKPPTFAISKAKKPAL